MGAFAFVMRRYDNILCKVEAANCSIYILSCSCKECTRNMAAILGVKNIFLLSFFLSLVQLSTCGVVKGTVSCVHCTYHDLSGFFSSYPP